jgi:hypothetical protein
MPKKGKSFEVVQSEEILNDLVLLPEQLEVPQLVSRRLREFVTDFKPYEVKRGAKLFLYSDERSGAFYVTCHLDCRVLTQSCDTKATLDPDDDDEIYKLNREITEDKTAYVNMEKDALGGRSFRGCSSRV